MCNCEMSDAPNSYRAWLTEEPRPKQSREEGSSVKAIKLSQDYFIFLLGLINILNAMRIAFLCNNKKNAQSVDLLG